MSFIKNRNIVYGVSKIRTAMSSIDNALKERRNNYRFSNLKDYTDEIKALREKSQEIDNNETTVYGIYEIIGQNILKETQNKNFSTIEISNIDLIKDNDFDYAFENCDYISSANIITKYLIGGFNGAFKNCKNLKKAIFNADEISFNMEGSIPVKYNGGNIDLQYSNSLKDCFAGCDSLEEIAFPKQTLVLDFENDLFKLFYENAEWLFGNRKNVLLTFANGSIHLEDLYRLNRKYGIEEIIIDNWNRKIYSVYPMSCAVDLDDIPSHILSIDQNNLSNMSELNVTGLHRKTSVNLLRDISSVTIPDNIKLIGPSVFAASHNLSNVSFDSLSNLTMINFISASSNPLNEFHKLKIKNEEIKNVCLDGISSIGQFAFVGCTELTGVSFSNLSNVFCISYDNEYSNPLFYAHDLFIDGELISDFEVPEAFCEVNAYSFAGCKNFKEIVLPKRVSNVGPGAFWDTEISSVTIFSNNCTYCDAFQRVVELEPEEIGAPAALKQCVGTIKKVCGPIGLLDTNDLYYPSRRYNGNRDIGTHLDMLFDTTAIEELSLFLEENTQPTFDLSWQLSGNKYRFDDFGNPMTWHATLSDGTRVTGPWSECHNLTSLHLEGISSINSNCLINCLHLKELTISNSPLLTSIQTSAIYNGEHKDLASNEHSFVSSIVLPKSIKKIEENGFGPRPSRIKNLVFDGMTEYEIEAIDGYPFGIENPEEIISYNEPSTVSNDFVFNRNTLVEYTNITATAIAVPDSYTWRGEQIPVLEIASGAFANNSVVTDISLPKLESIDDSAFKNKTSLSNIVFRGTVDRIGNEAFSNTALSSPVFPPGLKSIGNMAYSNDGRLIEKFENFWEDCEYSGNIHGDSILSTISKIEVTVPSSVSEIGLNPFGTAYVSSIVLNCEEVNLKDLLYTTTEGFYDTGYITQSFKTLIRELNKTDEWELIEYELLSDFAFNVNLNLTINSKSLSTNSWLVDNSVSCTIETNLSDWCGYSFKNPNLHFNTILKEKNSIDNIEHIEIPNGVSSINAFTFARYPSLTSVTIPSSVIHIDTKAFALNENIQTISVSEENSIYESIENKYLKTKDNSVFLKCIDKELSSYKLPYGTQLLGFDAFGDISSLKSIDLPPTLLSIENYALANTDVWNITFPRTLVRLHSGLFAGDIRYYQDDTRYLEEGSGYRSYRLTDECPLKDNHLSLFFEDYYTTELLSVALGNGQAPGPYAITFYGKGDRFNNNTIAYFGFEYLLGFVNSNHLPVAKLLHFIGLEDSVSSNFEFSNVSCISKIPYEDRWDKLTDEDRETFEFNVVGAKIESIKHVDSSKKTLFIPKFIPAENEGQWTDRPFNNNDYIDIYINSKEKGYEYGENYETWRENPRRQSWFYRYYRPVVEISDGALSSVSSSDLSSVEKIYVPNTIKKLPVNFLSYFTNLKEIDVEPGSELINDGLAIYNEDKTELLYVFPGVKNLTLNQNTSTINPRAFASTMNLVLTVPEENQYFYTNPSAVGIERYKIYNKVNDVVLMILPNVRDEVLKIMSLDSFALNALEPFCPKKIMIYDELSYIHDIPVNFFKNIQSGSIVYFMRNQSYDLPKLPNYSWGAYNKKKVITQIANKVCSMKFY